MELVIVPFGTDDEGNELKIVRHNMPFGDIGKGAQFEPGFLRISPNNKIPALVDMDGPGGRELSIFESGAILMYLAEKAGRFFPTGAKARSVVTQWIMFQMAGLGPMMGQANVFYRYAPEKIPYAIERYQREVRRLFGEAGLLPVGSHTYLLPALHAHVAALERCG